MRTFDFGTNPRRQTRTIKKIVVHKEYDADRPRNDIALIVLEKPFMISRTFEPVNVTKSGPVDNESCRVGKWIKNNNIAIAFGGLKPSLFHSRLGERVYTHSIPHGSHRIHNTNKSLQWHFFI